MCSHDNAGAGNCCGQVHVPSGSQATHCHCTPHMPRGFLLPGIMLLIAEEPSHGYSLMDKLAEMGMVKQETDLSIVYRVLRGLEEDGLAVSDHVDEGRGPARKVYQLTDAGRDSLSAWSDHLEDVDRLIGEFQGRFESLGKDA